MNLDIRVGIHGGNQIITACRGEIIEQEAYPHAPVGSTNQAIRQEPAGGIRFPDVVLHIQRLFREIDQRDARSESPATLGNNGKPRLARVLDCRLLEQLAHAGVEIILER